MGIKPPLIISIALHVGVLLLFCSNIGNIFSSKIKDTGYVVFDYVEIGKKSKAPIISQQEGKLSKTTAKTDEKETVNQESPPKESAKTEKKQIEAKKEKKEKSVVLDKKKKKSPPSKVKREKKPPKKTDTKSKANDKAVVNLRKNKKMQD